MKYILLFIFGFIAYLVGIFCFAQIIGSIRSRQKKYGFTIVIWIIILIFEFFVFRLLLPNYMLSFYIGTVISFITMMFQRNIE